MAVRNRKGRFLSNKQHKRYSNQLRNINKTVPSKYEITVDHPYSFTDEDGTPAFSEEVVIDGSKQGSWTEGRRIEELTEKN